MAFELHGIDEILAMKRSIRAPLKQCNLGVYRKTPPWKPFEHLRVSGNQFPGVVKDERFPTSEGIMFFEIVRPQQVRYCHLKTMKSIKKIIFEVGGCEFHDETDQRSYLKNSSEES